jgi:hypothetical protein
MSTAHVRGARARTSKRPPSVNLVAVVDQLSKAIDAINDGSARGSSWPLFSYDQDGSRLQVNTRGVLSRLWSDKAFSEEFTPGETTGFVHDVLLPPHGRDAVIGGRMVEDRIHDLPHAVVNLRSKVEKVLTAFLAEKNLSASSLLALDPQVYLDGLADELGASFDSGRNVAEMVPIIFSAASDNGVEARRHDVGRLMGSVEIVETKDWISSFENPARKRLRKLGLDEDEVEDALDNVKTEAARSNSQTSRFINFLEDYALARVRLEVACSLMQAIKKAASKRRDTGSQLLVRFIDNIEAIRNKYLETEEVFSFDVSGRYGECGIVNVSEYLRNAMFYGCLAVWPEPVTQMFEIRPASGNVTREISYHFRINGNNPQGSTSFEARVEALKEVLIQSEDRAEHVRRSLGQLAFLSVVIPREDHLDKPESVADHVQKFHELIRAEGGVCIDRLVSRLEQKSNVVEKIADALVDVVRTHGTSIIAQAERSIDQLYITVQGSVVEWQRLATATTNSAEFFIRPGDSGDSESRCWFRHVVITRNPASVPDGLFSVRVTTHLRERVLTRRGAGDSYLLQMQRQYAQPLMPVAIMPYCVDKESGEWIPMMSLPKWRSMPGIDIQVEERSLANAGKVKNKPKEVVQHQHAATTCAYSILAYLVIWLLRDKIAAEKGETPRLLILRGQNENRNLALTDRDTGLTTSGSEVSYAISQAIELTLGCEGPVFMQGISLANHSSFRDSGAFAAFISAFPLAIQCKEAAHVPCVALINYTTRPSSMHANFASETSYLYTVKTYVASTAAEGFDGHVLREDRTQLHIQSADGFKEPALIFEEIARLYDLGCKHIMLLWQHYNNRHIGRTADRHAPHSAPDFMEQVAAKFPDVTIYPLCRDVFPAMRLPQEQTRKSAFEVLRGNEHEDFWLPSEDDIRRELLPVYTFATMAVVGSESRRPQSGFCTYFLEFDARLSNREWAERSRTNLLDPNQDSRIRPVLISVLRGLHYLHAEREAKYGKMKPKLDPHHWITPTTIAGAGELKVLGSRNSGAIVLSFPSILSQISTVLRGHKK